MLQSILSPSILPAARTTTRLVLSRAVALRPAFSTSSTHQSTSPSPPRIKPSRRSLLYVPGSDPRKLSKSQSSKADALIFDLEDSVATHQKGAARSAVFDALQASPSRTSAKGVEVKGVSEKFVRINSGQMAADDLEIVLKSKWLEGIVIPKVDTAADVQRIDMLIDQHGLKETKDSIRIIASVESPLSLMNLKEIAHSSPRLDGLLFASEDYCASSDLIRTRSRREMLYARSAIVATAKAYGLQAIDCVCVSYTDVEELGIEAREGREMGFDGKQAIHPGQVDIIQSTFSPSEKEIEKAVAILAQYEIASKGGKGAYGFEDAGVKVMIDAPILLQANAVLQKAKAAGMDIPTFKL